MYFLTESMNDNQYHLLAFIPATDGWEMPAMLEAMAQRLVASGKLRINADHERNYVRIGSVASDRTFTTRELTDPALAAATERRLAAHVAPALGAQGIADLRAQLMRDLRKARGIDLARELKVARVLVQSAHPAVIALLLREGTEVFISYSHNVADLMPVHAWGDLGTASGLQSTEDTGTAIYVSAGGDPFFEGTQKTYVTDGFPALARMLVITGQELGHFADLRRRGGHITGRHSLDPNHSQFRADPAARSAWASDRVQVGNLRARYHALGLARLVHAEQRTAFYHARRRYSPPWLFWQAWRLAFGALFAQRCRKAGIGIRLSTYPRLRHGESLATWLADMAYNLAPSADAYRRDDPLVEEAILVLEAVARVPQQVHKWGEVAVMAAWPGLYRFYVGGIIPACEAAIGGPVKIEEKSILQQLVVLWRRWRRGRPGYYP